ncbi:MAG: N-acetylmuramoyl-L-alanine amidase [Clostridia bacterium]|nr:N-acetylmuramoyl-L-alanine amidase [Clostridia bacterium]
MNKKNLIILIVAAVLTILAVALILIISERNTPTGSGDGQSSEVSSAQEEISSLESAASSSELEESSSEEEKIKLDVIAPKEDVTVYNDSINIRGSADPALPLYINDKEVELGDGGVFLYRASLNVGNNYFTVKQGEHSYKCVVRYRKTVILEVTPTEKLTLEGGSVLTVRARALAGSNVTATFNGKTVTLVERAIEHEEEYADFFGNFTMPVNYDSDKKYGKITFSAKSNVGNGKAEGSSITVKKTNRPEVDDGYVMPKGEQYIDVGHTYIAEVVCRSAETFNPKDSVDYSRPVNNYLPKGTVDYCTSTVNKMYISGETIEFRTLRYGKQLYVKTESSGQNLKVYKGKLPETNKLNIASFTSEGRHTKLTLDVDWKAPFYFDLLPQKYYNDGTKNLDYTITAATYTYIDITFCYASELSGSLDLKGNNIFSSYEIIKNKSDYTLRLYLKKKGVFYGWSAEYNSQGQLEFSFLNPVILEKANNKYGYSLKGAVILVDAGHGGTSSGALGFDSQNTEAALNLKLAKMLQKRLISYGATVYMTRTDNSTVDSADRIELLRNIKPDYVISIHRNASSSSDPRAFNSYHFNAFSADAAKLLYKETANKNLYKTTKWSGVKWHYFFLARCTESPSVLTENGFMTNLDEYNSIIRDDFNEKCADAFVDGIFAYFKSIQDDSFTKPTEKPPVSSELPESSEAESSEESTSVESSSSDSASQDSSKEESSFDESSSLEESSEYSGSNSSPDAQSPI